MIFWESIDFYAATIQETSNSLVSPVWFLGASVIFDFHTTFWWTTCSNNSVSRPKTFLPHGNYQFGYQSTAFLIFIHYVFQHTCKIYPHVQFGRIRVVTLLQLHTHTSSALVDETFPFKNYLQQCPQTVQCSWGWFLSFFACWQNLPLAVSKR